jgi:hypothetical protein
MEIIIPLLHNQVNKKATDYNTEDTAPVLKNVQTMRYSMFQI